MTEADNQLTMRDQFAIGAMPTAKEIAEELYSLGGGGFNESLARNAYAIADAMLKARNL